MSKHKTRSELRDLLHTNHTFCYPDFAAIEIYLEALLPTAEVKGATFNITNYRISRMLGGYLVTPLTVATKVEKLARQKLIKKKLVNFTKATNDCPASYKWQITI